MGFWERVGGAGLGWAIGGPLGALIGLIGTVVLEEVLDDGEDTQGGLVPTQPVSAAQRELIFGTGLIALCAKMARADGVVTNEEVAAFKRVVQVSPADQRRVEALFDLAKKTTLGFEAYATQLGELFRDEPQLLVDVMDGLFHVAKADGMVHERELAYLKDVATLFGFTEQAYAQIEARHVRSASDPYAILGADRSWSEDQLRRQYLKMVKANHPDRSIAAGLPHEAIAIANSRLSAINGAWDAIQRERAALVAV